VYLDGFDGVDSFVGTRFTRSGPGWLRKTLATNLDLSGEFTTGAVQHKLLVGLDGSRFTDDTPGSTGDLAGAAPVNIYHPVFGNHLAALQALAASDATNMLWRDKSTDAGLYLQDQMTLSPQWDLLLGGRYDRAEDAYADTYGSRDSACYPHCTAAFPATPYATDKAFSPRAGLLYKLSASTSVYASYARSFGASNGRDNLGHRLQPQAGTQFELGAKAVLAEGKVTASATLFDLTKTNITEYDPVSYFPHVVGEARSRGLELDLAGQLSPRWSVIGSYTADQALITHDPYSGTQGKRLSGVAPQVLSLWAKFDTAPGAAAGWALGAGIYGSAARQGDDANTWQLPGYARVDAMLAYRTRLAATRVAAQLNLSNLLDQRYFDHGGYGAAAYGAPRNLTGSVKLEF
jgi:iron complex outermembrane receptor protein